MCRIGRLQRGNEENIYINGPWFPPTLQILRIPRIWRHIRPFQLIFLQLTWRYAWENGTLNGDCTTNDADKRENEKNFENEKNCRIRLYSKNWEDVVHHVWYDLLHKSKI